MDVEADQPLLQPHEQEKQQEPNFQKESHEVGFDLKNPIEQVILTHKQLKSLHILQSAVEILKSNKKYMLLMVFSTIPFFIFNVFFEVKLQKAVAYASKLPEGPLSNYYNDFDFEVYAYANSNSQRWVVLHPLLELCPLYLVVYPLLELLSSSVIIKIAAKVHAGEKDSTLKVVIDEVLSQMNGTLRGCLSTTFWVHLLSTSTLVGLFWIVANCFLMSGSAYWPSYYYYDYYSYIKPEVFMNPLLAMLHALVFVAVLYKYLDWSALWNMGMVISVLEEETGIEALEMSSYYAKRCRRTGFDLMLGFFAYGAVLRVLCMVVVGKLNADVGAVMVTAIGGGFVCLGNLVKWVALVLYFYDCKAQTLQKKVDEEMGKGHDAC